MKGRLCSLIVGSLCCLKPRASVTLWLSKQHSKCSSIAFCDCFLLTVNLFVSLAVFVVLVSFLSLLQNGFSPLSTLRCTSSLLTSCACFEPGLPESSPFCSRGCSLEWLHGCYSGSSCRYPRISYTLRFGSAGTWIHFFLHYFCLLFWWSTFVSCLL